MGRVPLAVEWPLPLLLGNGPEHRLVLGDEEVSLHDAELILERYEPGPPNLLVRSPVWQVEYRVDIGPDGLVVAAVGDDVRIRTARSDNALSDYLTAHGLQILLAGDGVIVAPGVLLQSPRDLPPYDRALLRPLDWTGIDIRRESQGPERDPTTVQARMLREVLAEDWQVVLDDDGTGEVADIVALRIDERELHVLLLHCKFSHGPAAAARVADLYELCGQAQKSARHRQDPPAMLQRLIARERGRLQRSQPTGFMRGSPEDLYAIRDRALLLRPRFHIALAQPGLTRAGASPEQLSLLAGTELYVQHTAGADLSVLCSALTQALWTAACRPRVRLQASSANPASRTRAPARSAWRRGVVPSLKWQGRGATAENDDSKEDRWHQHLLLRR